jgi:hypothetical protein
MAIPEAQLDAWDAQGSVKQSKDTYASVKGTLEDSKSPYYKHSFDPAYLQGSYGNDTNVWRDSDVDVVFKLDAVYYKDVTRLSADELALYNKDSGGAVTYSYFDFKKDVTAWLTKNYGASVNPGKKAIYIKGEGNARFFSRGFFSSLSLSSSDELVTCFVSLLFYALKLGKRGVGSIAV